jgi:hypothetical protein
MLFSDKIDQVAHMAVVSANILYFFGAIVKTASVTMLYIIEPLSICLLALAIFVVIRAIHCKMSLVVVILTEKW